MASTTAPTRPARSTRAGRSRRTQEERVEAMRARLLDATIECLATDGLAGCSTNEVVRRAGVSRGALAHHFPSKAELLAAAAEHLIELRAVAYREAFVALPAEQHTVAAALDLLWEQFQAPAFDALAELIVAARTDDALRGALADGPERIARAALDVFVEVLPDVAAHPAAEPLLRGVLALFTGIAVQTIVEGDHHGHHAELRAVATVLGEQLLAATAPDPTVVADALGDAARTRRSS